MFRVSRNATRAIAAAAIAGTTVKSTSRGSNKRSRTAPSNVLVLTGRGPLIYSRSINPRGNRKRETDHLSVTSGEVILCSSASSFSWSILMPTARGGCPIFAARLAIARAALPSAIMSTAAILPRPRNAKIDTSSSANELIPAATPLSRRTRQVMDGPPSRAVTSMRPCRSRDDSFISPRAMTPGAGESRALKWLV